MQDSLPTYTLEGENIKNINSILTALNELDVTLSNNSSKHQVRFRLLKRLYINSSYYFQTQADRDKAKEILDVLAEELNKMKRKHKSTFIDIADQFEIEIRHLIHKKLKAGGTQDATW